MSTLLSVCSFDIGACAYNYDPGYLVLFSLLVVARPGHPAATAMVDLGSTLDGSSRRPALRDSTLM
jgi:hypothetical protein